MPLSRPTGNSSTLLGTFANRLQLRLGCRTIDIMKLTTHRQAVLDYLTSVADTRSAAQVHTALPHINLVTIYRALEYLVANAQIKKVSLGGDEAYFEVQHEPHHHALCTDCGKVIHFTTDDVALKQEFSLPGFVIGELEVTLKGRCKVHQN